MESAEKPAENAENPPSALEPRWLSQNECERELTLAGDPVTQQVLSRYLARYPEIPRIDHGRRAPMQVDFNALQAHRRNNIAVQEAAARETAPSAAATAPVDTGGGDLAADLRMRERLAKAEQAEFDLAKARGELLPRVAVLRGIQAAGVELDQSQRTTLHQRGEALLGAKDVRAIVAILQKQDDEVRTRFAAALGKLADASDDEEAVATAAAEPPPGAIMEPGDEEVITA